jgi:CBS domain-containing protein
MNVASVMTSPVITTSLDAPISDALGLMIQKGLSGLPVVDPNGVLVGILSEGDFLRRGELGTDKHRPRWIELFLSDAKLADEYIYAHGRRVSEIMSTDVACVSPADDLQTCVKLMLDRGVKRLPVIEAGKLVGILTRADLMRALVSRLPAESKDASDAQIHADIRSAFRALSWTNNRALVVAVNDGAVQLSGSVFDERTKQALIVLAENVNGVQSVTDNLLLIDPYTGTPVPTSVI